MRALFAAAAVLVLAGSALAQDEAKRIKPEDLQWKPNPLLKGADGAVLLGDPAKAGVVVNAQAVDFFQAFGTVVVLFVAVSGREYNFISSIAFYGDLTDSDFQATGGFLDFEFLGAGIACDEKCCDNYCDDLFHN